MSHHEPIVGERLSDVNKYAENGTIIAAELFSYNTFTDWYFGTPNGSEKVSNMFSGYAGFIGWLTEVGIELEDRVDSLGEDMWETFDWYETAEQMALIITSTLIHWERLGSPTAAYVVGNCLRKRAASLGDLGILEGAVQDSCVPDVYSGSGNTQLGYRVERKGHWERAQPATPGAVWSVYHRYTGSEEFLHIADFKDYTFAYQLFVLLEVAED